MTGDTTYVHICLVCVGGGAHVRLATRSMCIYLSCLLPPPPLLLQAFIEAGDLATFLKLRPITGIHMPVPLNIIFVGFEKDGNLHVNIPPVGRARSLFS